MRARPDRLLGSRGADLGPVVFAIEFVSLFFARALSVWFYGRDLVQRVLAAIFHASFNAAISPHSYDVAPTSQTVRFLIFSAVIVFAGTTVIIATKRQLGRAKEAAETQAAASDLDI